MEMMINQRSEGGYSSWCIHFFLAESGSSVRPGIKIFYLFPPLPPLFPRPPALPAGRGAPALPPPLPLPL